MTTPATVPLTAEQCAILRSWLGGNDVWEIARGRRVDAGTVVRTVAELCDMDRLRGRRVLDAGCHTVTPVVVPAPDPPKPPRPARPAVKRRPKPLPEPAPEPEPPAPVVEPQPAITADAYRVLHAYARGAYGIDISHDLGMPYADVMAVIREVGMDRNEAATLAARAEAGRMAGA